MNSQARVRSMTGGTAARAFIDLRSDTVTTPTPRMREAIARAAVGDDVLGEDSTVRQLEERSAALLGKEEGLFVVSGTLANLLALATFCNRGQEVILADTSHIYNLEVAAISAVAGLQPRPLRAVAGNFDLDELADAIRPAALQVAATGLVCLEETFDLNQGLVVPPAAISKMAAVAVERGISVYMDGARVFNAAVALGVPAAVLVAPIDAAMFCLTKGLACPIGSVLVGTKAFISVARRFRQQLGGGWRQAGILAAAGLVALDEMIDRLSEDHARARRLAELLFTAGFGIDLSQVQSNIIRVDLSPLSLEGNMFARALAAQGIRVKVIGPSVVRMVTHKDISDVDVEEVGRVLPQVLDETMNRQSVIGGH